MHVHCFTLADVPEQFFDSLIGGKRFLRISKLRSGTLNRFFVRLVTRRWFIWLVRRFSRPAANQLRRLKGLLKYCSEPTQEALLEKLRAFYEKWKCNTLFHFVPLTMDMEFMDAGKPSRQFEEQLRELRLLKSSPRWKEIIHPFIFADPRRPDVYQVVRGAITGTNARFSGIKLYPALGYYPFDKRLRDVYLFAIEKNLPIVSHCVHGSVFFRGKPPEESRHPFTGRPCFGNTAEEYQLNWTHPLNYELLLNSEYLERIWGAGAPDLAALKICLAHFGGENEWLDDRNMLRFWQKRKPVQLQGNVDYLDPLQDWFGEKRNKWFPIIVELMRKYPNVFADISFTLHNKEIYGRLKQMLLDDSVRDKILFGTDYYVVSSVADEPEVLATLESELNNVQLFELIASENPRRFLGW